MTDTASPFDERKTSRWVWIVPSVLLHLAVLWLWLSMPEEPPRQPGQRELVVDADQAEQLQELVEDSNLRELRADVAEMQAIKERMARIRAEKMEGLQSFEQTMLEEAPKDVAVLISEVLELQASVRKLGEHSLEVVKRIREASGPVEELLEKDQVAAVRAMKDLLPVRNEIAGVRDQLEESVSTSKAIAGAIRTRMEWISDPDTLGRISGFLDDVAAMNERINELNQEIGGSVGGRPRRFLGELVAEEASVIETLRAYEEMEKSEAAKQARQETEDQIQQRKAELAKLKKELEANRERIRSLEGKDRNGLARVIKQQERRINSLPRHISRAEQRLERKGYLPDNGLKRNHDRLQWKIREAFRRPADPEVFEAFLDRQAAFVRQANELRTDLEAM